MTKEQLKDYLVKEAEYDREIVERMDGFHLLDSYLRWNGLLGWTYNIVDVVKAIGIKNL